MLLSERKEGFMNKDWYKQKIENQLKEHTHYWEEVLHTLKMEKLTLDQLKAISFIISIIDINQKVAE